MKGDAPQGEHKRKTTKKKIELASSERSETTVDSHKRIGCYEKRAGRKQERSHDKLNIPQIHFKNQ